MNYAEYLWYDDAKAYTWVKVRVMKLRVNTIKSDYKAFSASHHPLTPIPINLTSNSDSKIIRAAVQSGVVITMNDNYVLFLVLKAPTTRLFMNHYFLVIVLGGGRTVKIFIYIQWEWEMNFRSFPRNQH